MEERYLIRFEFLFQGKWRGWTLSHEGGFTRLEAEDVVNELNAIGYGIRNAEMERIPNER